MNLKPNIPARLKRKSKGVDMAVIGTAVLLTAVIIAALIFQRQALGHKLSIVEDTLVSSGLGGLKISTKAAAMDSKSRIDPEKCYDIVCELMGENLKLKRSGCSYSGNSEIVYGNVYLSKVEVFNVAGGEYQSYTFLGDPSGSHTMQEGKNETTPNGFKVEDSGVYVELTFDAKLCGIQETVKKGEYVELWHS